MTETSQGFCHHQNCFNLSNIKQSHFMCRKQDQIYHVFSNNMRTKYQIHQEAPPDVVTTCLYGNTPQQKQWCPVLTRTRLMTALGVSLITTILLLLQCIPGSFHPELFCCQVRDDGPLNSATVLDTQSMVRTTQSADADRPLTSDDLEDDVMFMDTEYDDRAEGGDRIRYKHTKRHLPQCIIIGVRKGGTRALLEFLDLHPAIQAEKQEMHFFDDDDNFNKGMEWYRKKMPWSYTDQVTLEKTPAYFVEDKVPGRIHQMNSSIKLLLIVRDPIERTISDYMQIHSSKLAKGHAHESFEELVMDSDIGDIDKNYKPIRRSIYHRHMEEWLRYFDLSQFHIVNGENLVRDPVSELSKVETFLGLEHRLSVDNFYFNQTKKFYCMHLQTRQKCLAASKGRKHPKIDPVVMQKLRRFFRPLNNKFYDMVGINFGWQQ